MILNHELKADFNASRYIEVLGRSECLRVLSVNRLSRLKSTFTGGGGRGLWDCGLVTGDGLSLWTFLRP